MKAKHSTRSIRLIAILFLLSVLIIHPTFASAEARQWFVSPTGSGSACTQANPCRMDYAIPNSAEDDVIIVKGGTYAGNALLTITHPLTVRGSWTGNPSGTPIHDTVNSRTIVEPYFHPAQIAVISYNPENNYDRVFLDDMTFRDGHATTNTYYSSGGCVYVERGIVYLRNLKMEDCEADDYGGAVYVRSTEEDDNRVYIYDSIFNNNTAEHGGGAIMTGWDVSGTINRNTFYYNSASYGSAIHTDRTNIDIDSNNFHYHPGPNTISLSGNSNYEVNFTNNIVRYSAGTALDIYGYDSASIYHNTFSNNSSTIIYASGDLSTIRFRNNIITNTEGNSNLFIEDGDARIIANTNVFWNNSQQNYVGSNAILEHPELDGTYHLKNVSPAIDAGLMDLGVTRDMDNERRDVWPDIGADEFPMQRMYLPGVVKE